MKPLETVRAQTLMLAIAGEAPNSTARFWISPVKAKLKFSVEPKPAEVTASQHRQGDASQNLRFRHNPNLASSVLVHATRHSNANPETEKHCIVPLR